ncbi:uncharacterized protein SPPG_04332 [Spizellomyces punctatus DAOM BR117]|uniref:Ribosomal protein L22 n=1 Tax=Spizellomyces punctatus (strain DAOM BR117) TaxID=645134 RepID=A0A0L0HIH1_SPIPD|nr:uncharacterized protein SPPG_04332 [Spizellomyces punctatus DAOM BR117]KND01241.1 hypothetical protein SPPG_04332 [Spizellomyces punctatus DAOM BR117]|eukprot:XP_016609280.1 hypothetical protein SPPG_04332 [Spizellomyces punctatus DAOM BR117]
MLRRIGRVQPALVVRNATSARALQTSVPSPSDVTSTSTPPTTASKAPQSFRPSVYPRIRDLLRDGAYESPQTLQQTTDQLEGIRRAQEAVAQGRYAVLQPNSTSKRPKKPHQAFLARLREDGGDKIVSFRKNFLHTEYTRFVTLCDQVKGLTLDQALLQIRWLRKPITKKMEEALKEAIVKAKEQGLDLKKTFVADAYVKENAAILQSQLVKRYLRGRGRYGATPHPVTALLEITLQEREKPFSIRDSDPLEWLRERLRDRQRPFVKSAEEVYNDVRSKRPIKQVFC